MSDLLTKEEREAFRRQCDPIRRFSAIDMARALATIDALEAANRDLALEIIAAHGQAQEHYEARQKAEADRTALLEVLNAFVDAARIDACMDGPRIMGWNRSQLDRALKRWEAMPERLRDYTASPTT
jgi:hypothetical protein